MTKRESYGQRLERVIPGGAHTYSRGRDQFPANLPRAFSHGKGAYIFDPGNTKYLDYGMGLRSVTLGYAEPRVYRSVKKAIKSGNNLTGPSTTELFAAEELLATLGWPDMVKFAKNGSNVTTAAIKLARSQTSRDWVLVPKGQPFFSFDDWFIGTTPMTKGVLNATSDRTLTFELGSPESVVSAWNKSGGQVAAVILEPAGPGWGCDPPMNCPRNCINGKEGRRCLGRLEFLQWLRNFCDEKGCILIFDEMIAGFRLAMGGGGEFFSVKPDLATFGKAIANGFSVAALVGKGELMSLGGINSIGMERTFLLSSTHGSEMSSLAALRATIKIYEQEDVISRLGQVGSKLVQILQEAISASKLQDFVSISGFSVSPFLTFHGENQTDSQRLRTIFLETMADRKIIASWFSPSLAHGPKEQDQTAVALHDSMQKVSLAIQDSAIQPRYGEVVKPVFRKHN